MTTPEDDRPAGGPPDTIQITFGRQITFAGLLERLGHLPDEIISLCSDRDGTFRCVSCTRVKWALGVISPPEHTIQGYAAANCWFSINPIHDGLTRGRGKAEDAARLATVAVDLDFGEGKCGSDNVALAVADDLAAVLGQPAAVTLSGHGLHPYWPIADGVIDDTFTHEEAKTLLTRFHALVAGIATRHGAEVDNVFDLARVLRVPGTVNVKPGMEPAEVTCYEGTGKPLTVGQVKRILDQHGVPEHPEKMKARRKSGGGARTVAIGEEWLTQGKASREVLSQLALAMDRSHGRSLRADDASRHGNIRGDVLALARLGKRGEPGVSGAIELLRAKFVSQVGPDRPGGEAEAAREFDCFLDPARVDALLDDDEHDGAAVIDEERLWARPSIGYLRDFARARMVSPLAVLGAALVHVAARIPHTVVLPALVGSEGSLNLIVGLVGPSSVGKDAADAASQSALGFDWRRVPVVPMGSAEGIAGTYRPPGTDSDSPNPCTRAVFTAAEVDTWAGLAARSGSTLTAEIRLLYAGQQIGQGNVSKTTRRIVAAHSYRACVLMGIQPLRSAALLDAADGGLPQRILFLPANDPDVPGQRPEDPKQHRIYLPEWPVNDTGTGNSRRHVLKVPERARAVSDEQRRARLRAPLEDDASNGHGHFTQLKVAAALMALDGRGDGITDEDYDLAGIITARSALTLQACRRALTARAIDVNRGKGRARADQEEAAADRKVQRCKDRILDGLRKVRPGGQLSHSDLRKGLRVELRGYFDQAMAELIEKGQVDEINLHRGVAYTLGTRVHPRKPQSNCEIQAVQKGAPMYTLRSHSVSDQAKRTAGCPPLGEATTPASVPHSS